MKGIIVIKDGKDIKKVMNMKGFIEMRLRKLIDKLNCQLVGDEQNTVIFHVRTSDKRFDELKNELDNLYPGSCVYLMPKTES